MRTALKQFRIGVHLTQVEFAKKCGCGRANYSFIERGERSGSAQFWANLQKTFNVPDEQMYRLMKLDEVKQCGMKEK